MAMSTDRFNKYSREDIEVVLHGGENKCILSNGKNNTRELKMHRQKHIIDVGLAAVCAQTESWKAGSDVIDVLTSENIENSPLRSRMYLRMNFTSGVIPSKRLASI